MSDIRGVVLESGEGWATVLLENGEYKAIKTHRLLEPGEKYIQKKNIYYRRYAAAAAIFLLMFISVVDFFNVVAYAQVSSGLEMGINRWDRVVSVSTEDSSDEGVVDNMKLKGQKLEDALEMVLEQSLSGTDNDVIPEISVSLRAEGDNGEPVKAAIIKKVTRAMEQACSSHFEYSREVQVSEPEQGDVVCQVRRNNNKEMIMNKQQDKIDQISGKTQKEMSGQYKIDKENNGNSKNAVDDNKQDNNDNAGNKNGIDINPGQKLNKNMDTANKNNSMIVEKDVKSNLKEKKIKQGGKQ